MEGPREYSHQKVMSKIDDLKKSLGDLQDKLLKESGEHLKHLIKCRSDSQMETR